MRRLAWFAVPFSAAVFLAVSLLPGNVLLPLGAAALAVFLLSLILRKRRTVTLALCLAAAGVSAGSFWCAEYEQRVNVPARELYGQTLRVTAQVAELPEATDYGTAVEARLTGETGRGLRVLFYLDEEQRTLEIGDEIETVARFSDAGIVMGEYQDYYASRGIALKAVGYGPVTRTEREGFSLYGSARNASLRIRDGIRRCFPEDVSAVIEALVTGEKGSLSQDYYSALRRCGLAHTVAVSGMHVMFLVGMLNLLMRRRRWAAALSIAAIVFFALMVGATPSVVRAGIMQILLLLAPLLDRDYDPVTALSLALMLLLLRTPYAASSVGLQLSFAAVAGILCISVRLRNWLCEKAKVSHERSGTLGMLRDRVLDAVISSVSVSVGASLFTMPLTALHFGTAALWAPLSNLVALWAVTVAFAFGLLAGCAGLILAALGQVIGIPALLCVRFLQTVVPLLAKLPFASLPIRSGCLAAWLALAYGLLLLFCFTGTRTLRRGAVSAALCVGTLLLAVGLNAALYSDGALALTVLDVGQGQSVLVRLGNSYGMVDCGGSKEAGETAADLLESIGRRKLDFLILTHCHDDHANGVPALLERVSVERLFLPAGEEDLPLRAELLARAEAQGCEVFLVSALTELQMGEGGRMTLYPPLGSGSSNERGLSALVECQGFSGLITGDMGAEVERKLLSYADLPDLDLLVVGHHGSRNAASQELLDRTKPEYAVISVGYNTFGHPATETLARLEETGAVLYRTDRDGSVTIHAGRAEH